MSGRRREVEDATLVLLAHVRSRIFAARNLVARRDSLAAVRDVNDWAEARRLLLAEADS